MKEVKSERYERDEGYDATRRKTGGGEADRRKIKGEKSLLCAGAVKRGALPRHL